MRGDERRGEERRGEERRGGERRGEERRGHSTYIYILLTKRKKQDYIRAEQDKERGKRENDKRDVKVSHRPNQTDEVHETGGQQEGEG